MRRYALKTLRDALYTWGALAIGITITAVLYALLNVAGFPANTSLLIAFITLVGLILLGVLLAPQSLFSLREGILEENRSQLSKDVDPNMQSSVIPEIRQATSYIQSHFVLSENGTSAIVMLPVAQSQISIIIKDTAKVVLSSSELTDIVFSAIIRASTEVWAQGIKSISLTIDRHATDLEIISIHGAITRKLRKFEIAVTIYSAERDRILNSSYSSKMKQEWLTRIEESFYQQMADIANKELKGPKTIASLVDRALTYTIAKSYSANVLGKIHRIEADMILEQELNLSPRREKDP